MILSLEQIRSITNGVIDVEECNGEITFYRFGKNQREYYRCNNESFYIKSGATAGVNFDFYTDSDKFSFDFTAGKGSSRSFYYFDIYVDGILVKHVGEEKMWIMKGKVSVDLAAHALPSWVNRDDACTERHVTVWLPNLAKVTVSNVTLDDGATLRPVVYDKKFLYYGDSITQGYDAKYSSLSYANRLTRRFNAYAVNQAIGGEKFVPQIIDPELGYTPDLITVAYGTNDWSGYTKENFELCCSAFLEGIRKTYPSIKIIVILPIYRADCGAIPKKYGGSFAEACSYIRGQAEKNGCVVVEGWKLMPQNPDFYADLRLHPNDLGFAEYAERLSEIINNNL